MCGFEERRAVGLIVWCCGIIHVLPKGVFGWMMGWDGMIGWDDIVMR